jgi:hypothetical protein
VDSAHAPLLYGPYVLYASLDGNWYRVNYEEAARKKKERIQVPFTRGEWQLVAVKNANWRYWTVVLQPPHKKTIEEYFLFAGGGSHFADDVTKPFLVARCVECGSDDADVTHFEADCLHVGYCSEHSFK